MFHNFCPTYNFRRKELLEVLDGYHLMELFGEVLGGNFIKKFWWVMSTKNSPVILYQKLFLTGGIEVSDKKFA